MIIHNSEEWGGFAKDLPEMKDKLDADSRALYVHRDYEGKVLEAYTFLYPFEAVIYKDWLKVWVLPNWLRSYTFKYKEAEEKC